jgi:hypothetical protein
MTTEASDEFDPTSAERAELDVLADVEDLGEISPLAKRKDQLSKLTRGALINVAAMSVERARCLARESVRLQRCKAKIMNDMWTEALVHIDEMNCSGRCPTSEALCREMAPQVYLEDFYDDDALHGFAEFLRRVETALRADNEPGDSPGMDGGYRATLACCRAFIQLVEMFKPEPDTGAAERHCSSTTSPALKERNELP